MTRAAVHDPARAFADAPDRACADRPDLTWHPERGGNAHVAAARAVCLTCPHLAPCRDWGVRHERFGIWGGTTQRERQRIRRELGITLETPGCERGPTEESDVA